MNDNVADTTLLIDGDIIAFRCAAAVQSIHEDEDGCFQPIAFRHDGEAAIDNLLHKLQEDFKATHFKIALTDPKENWRKTIWPSYKANRKDTFRPIMLAAMKGYLTDKYNAVFEEGLEADDVLGIWNTEPQQYPGRRILVGKDKDFLTIPCLYHSIGDVEAGRPVVRDITPWEAQMFHLRQTLMGDAVDGYGGCPGVGATRADRLLANPVALVQSTAQITRGPRKGESTVAWREEPTTDLWRMVVDQYRKASLGEKEALRMARLAHILHHEDYNWETKEITLWTPDRLVAQ